MIQTSIDVFFIRLLDVSLVECAVLCGLLKGHGFDIVSKDIRRHT